MAADGSHTLALTIADAGMSWKVPTPVLSLSSGLYTTVQTVTIRSADATAALYQVSAWRHRLEGDTTPRSISTFAAMLARLAKGLAGNRCAILAADASRRASLLVTYIRPLCALLAPRRAGASTPRMAHLFPDRP
jgi:hypothetical protein